MSGASRLATTVIATLALTAGQGCAEESDARPRAAEKAPAGKAATRPHIATQKLMRPSWERTAKQASSAKNARLAKQEPPAR